MDTLYPSFFALNGRKPIAYVDYDPDNLQQDDYEFYTGTGLYSDDVTEYPADDGDDCPMDGDAESALASAGHGTDEDYGYYGEDY